MIHTPSLHLLMCIHAHNPLSDRNILNEETFSAVAGKITYLHA